MIRADFVVRRVGELVTMVPRDGDALGRITKAAFAARQGRVVWVGKDQDVEASVGLDGDSLDAAGACIIPGLVDAHTHPVFAGSRADEFVERQTGISYQAQQASERGIMRTVRATREADAPTLTALARIRVQRFLASGTTTIEAKTGYGLDQANESKAFDVLLALSGGASCRIVPTFLGAHVVPGGVDRAAYLRVLLEEMLPAFRRRAVFCDAWCDEPAFTPAETRALLRRAQQLGYLVRVHAAQLGPGEGPDIAAELGAASADHLEYVTQQQVEALVAAGTVAVLCPSANLTTHGPRPPIEGMRKAGLRMAVASDLNPGTSNSENLIFAMSLACVAWGMTPLEVLAGATVHAAHSLRLDGLAGCLQVGSYADCAILDVESAEAIPYYLGTNRVMQTVVGGSIWEPS